MPEFEIPKKGKAAVVVNEGPDFRVEVQEVDVPEPSKSLSFLYYPSFGKTELSQSQAATDTMRPIQRTTRSCSSSTAPACACPTSTS